MAKCFPHFLPFVGRLVMSLVGARTSASDQALHPAWGPGPAGAGSLILFEVLPPGPPLKKRSRARNRFFNRRYSGLPCGS
ncbi:hypothetical protein FB451DRAFT_1234896 [Mycena latifolia]|nr:hypothetical protein FB451DRAFT_1234896 [Mycena latifolia]